MRVELRNHPAQAEHTRKLSDGQIEVTKLFYPEGHLEAGKPVPLFADQHGIYYSPAPHIPARCTGYCLKAANTPVCLIDNYSDAEAEFIKAEVARLRGGPESKFSMVSAPTVEVEDEPEVSALILPDGYDDEEEVGNE